MESKQKNKMETSTFSLNHLKVNGKLITDRKQIADLVASTISNKPSSEHYSPKFQAIKIQKERKTNLSILQRITQKNKPTLLTFRT